MTQTVLGRLLVLLSGDPLADRAVPPTGFTARLTLLSAGAMAFLAVFALALSLATGRLADRWSAELAKTATLRISAPQDQMDAQTRAALNVLETTPGVALARALDDAEQRALLAPWFGPDLPVETLPVPQLIEIVEDSTGFDAAGLRARLQAEQLLALRSEELYAANRKLAEHAEALSHQVIEQREENASLLGRATQSEAQLEVATQRAVMAQRRLWDSCLLYTSPSPRDRTRSRMPSSA